MNLIIETYKRGEGHLAVVCEDNALLSSAGCGGGETERDAIHQAVNAYFTHRANAAANAPIMPQGEFTLSIDIPRATYAGHPLSIGDDYIPPADSFDSGENAATPNTIQWLGMSVPERLRWAKDTSESVVIDYSSVDNVHSTRTIKVHAFEDKINAGALMGAVIHVKAYDLDIDEPRTFRQDRITDVRLPS